MKEIRPSIISQDIVCAETLPPPNAMVIFGASGDLVHRKLLSSLLQIYLRGLLPEQFYILGCGRTEFSDEQFRQNVGLTIKAALGDKELKQAESFIQKLYYISGDYGEPLFYHNIRNRLVEPDKTHNVDGVHIFYLAVPPFIYGTIVEQLGQAALSCPHQIELRQKVRLVVEKPFGRDLQSAVELNNKIRRCFDEPQIYRIDHYLGKETVQNILMFRFANSIFEPVWNRDYIDNIQITIAESIGVEHRGSFYDKTGALRDIFQNHMLGMLSLAAMEPPVSFEAEQIRDEKVKLLRSIRPFEPDTLDKFVIRGQYHAGSVNGMKTVGYRSEPGVNPDSKTETFVAAKLFIDNWRWKDVPFYLRTGKRLSDKNTEIAIAFKKIPHSMFASVGLDDMASNVLVLQIQPQEGISLSFQTKRPGSKICMSTLNMKFSYSDVFGIEPPDAYQRLLMDCMAGDQMLFTRQDDVEISWKLMDPILRAWENSNALPYEYPAGSESFPQANLLIESDGRKWRKLSGT